MLRYKYLVLPPASQEVLVQLRANYLLGLITNGPSNSQWEKIKMLELDSLFDNIIVSGDYVHEKPDAEIFDMACRHLQVQPNQCMMVGDKLETDILGGIQAQLGCTVWIPLYPEDIQVTREIHPDYIINTLNHLLKLLPKFSKPRVKSGENKTRYIHENDTKENNDELS